jgi:hypothetical protein
MPTLTPEDWARIRYAYEHSNEPIDGICAAYGISSGTLRDRVRRWKWNRRREPIPPIGPAPLAHTLTMTAPGFATPGNGVPAAREHASTPRMFEPSFRPDARPIENVERDDDARKDHAVLAAQPVAQAQDAYTEPAASASPPVALDENAGTATPDPATDAAPPPAYSRFIAEEAKAHGETADGASLGEQLRGAIARIMPAIERTLATLAAGPQTPRQMELAARSLGALTRTLRELNGLLAQHAAEEPEEPRDMNEFRLSLAAQIDAMIRQREEDAPRIYHEA